MIPRANITGWRSAAPWPEDGHVEQDLVLARALVELFQRPRFAEAAAFRGGTALHKLYFSPPGRYSEDLDFVQLHAGPIGPLVAEVRAALDHWLGEPSWKSGEGRFTLVYRFSTTSTPVVSRRVKIEFNTREHFSVHGLCSRSLEVTNPWFTGAAKISTYTLPELLGTKLRALYQRRKGRDLFDLRLALDHPEFDASATVSAFDRYMSHGGTPVSRAQLEANLEAKLNDPGFVGDVPPLLRTGLTYDAASAWSAVHEAVISKVAGEPWKGERVSTKRTPRGR